MINELEKLADYLDVDEVGVRYNRKDEMVILEVYKGDQHYSQGYHLDEVKFRHTDTIDIFNLYARKAMEGVNHAAQ
jgi:hypothetical protein